MQIVIRDILVNYEVLGESEKTLLILHGWGRSINEWIPTAMDLSSDFKVILLDLPGFGITNRPKESFEIFDYAEFVKDFLLKLEIDKCILIGHSFGGRIGLILSVSPDKLVEKLILVDSGGIEKNKLSVKLIRLIIPARRLFPNFIQKKIKKVIGSSDYNSSGEMRDIFIKVVNQDLSFLFKKIKIPTLIIWGEKDKVLNVDIAKEFKAGIVNSKTRIVWGAGHDPHLQKSDQFVEILKDEL